MSDRASLFPPTGGTQQSAHNWLGYLASCTQLSPKLVPEHGSAMITAIPCGLKESESASIPLSWSDRTMKYWHQRAKFLPSPVVAFLQGTTHQSAYLVSGSPPFNRLSRESPASQNPELACPLNPPISSERPWTVSSISGFVRPLRCVASRPGLARQPLPVRCPDATASSPR